MVYPIIKDTCRQCAARIDIKKKALLFFAAVLLFSSTSPAFAHHAKAEDDGAKEQTQKEHVVLTSKEQISSVSDETNGLPPAPSNVNLPQKDRLKASALTSRYDEKKDCFVLEGKVRITIGSALTIMCSEAEITRDSRTVWAKGTPVLRESDMTFTGDAIYINVDAQISWFYGRVCRLTRPGLSIRSDTMGYKRGERTAIFDGHVIYIDATTEKATTHMEYNVDTGKVS